jgi:peptide/nickel transport system ATP-binding protein
MGKNGLSQDIFLENLRVKFRRKDGDILAVRDVSAKLEAGKITGIIGESGSGKSVLGMSVLRLLPENSVTEGRILFEGKEILSLGEREMNEIRGLKIGLIPQSPSESLNPVLTIARQVTELFTMRKTSKKDARVFAERLLGKFHLPGSCMKSYAFQLSGGMKQRAVSAFGIGASPRWVIADEPTKGLDADLEMQVRSILKNVAQNAGLLLITHSLSLAAGICDAVIVMLGGRIVEQGSSDVLKNPLHPYTRGLLDSSPARGMKAMPFLPETADDRLCPVNHWCGHRMKICREEPPTLVETGDRKVRCLLFDKN